jgi:CRISPR-associated protein Cas5d
MTRNSVTTTLSSDQAMNEIPISLKTWGDFACFTAPEMRVERVSYPVMTPSAARGILEAIFWKPEIRYEVDEIAVLKGIQFVSVRRNEIQDTITVKGKAGVNAWMKDSSKFQPYLVDSAGRDDVQGENRTQRNSVILRDVAYVISARLIVKNPTPEDNPQKYREMFTRRVDSGQCFRQPYFGIREYAAHFEEPDGDETPIGETRDLGIMLYDLDFGPAAAKGVYPGKAALFAPARLENGVLNVAQMRANLYRKVQP